ncbi:MAG TPA: hypothetical protein VFW11_14250 [Cyclobacteriaceae bacterium]|nr:hypothetical protein [Cyclobacteriaceae bacterium]
MATVKNSMIVEKFSGKLYGVVFKQYRGGVVISKIPDMSNVKRSQKQRKCNRSFAEAVAYARSVLYDPEKRKEMVKRKSAHPKFRRSSIYHMAIREYFMKTKSPAPRPPIGTDEFCGC